MRRHTYGYLPRQGHRCPVTGTNLYCLVTEEHACEQLAQGRSGTTICRTHDVLSRPNHYTSRATPTIGGDIG